MLANIGDVEPSSFGTVNLKHDPCLSEDTNLSEPSMLSANCLQRASPIPEPLGFRLIIGEKSCFCNAVGIPPALSVRDRIQFPSSSRQSIERETSFLASTEF